MNEIGFVTNAIAYLRFSTPKQERGDSRDRQLRDIRAYCERKGWTLVEVVEDLGLSAYTGDHLHSGNLGKLTSRVLAGSVEPGTVIVVELLDRLSRQGHRKALRWMEDICDKGLSIAVVNGDRLYDAAGLQTNMFDLMEILMRAKIANDESDQKSIRVGAAWEKKLVATKQGDVLTKGCPGWLEAVGKGAGDDGTAFRLIPDRVAKVRQVYELSASGVGLPEITRRLNQQGSSWGRSGQGFSMTQIRRWLSTASIEGDFVAYEANAAKANGERVVGYYPRIVEADLVDQARAGLISRRRTGGPRYKNAYTNLFMGLFRCAQCFGSVVVTRTQGPGYLRCANAALGRGCSNKRLFRYKDFEASAVSEILHLALDDQFFRKGRDVKEASTAAAEAHKRIRDLGEQIDRITDLMAKVSDPEALIQKYDALGRELTAARDEASRSNAALVLARGQVSGAEHLSRVMDVSAAIYSTDHDVRLEARQRVHQAMKSIVSMIVCDPEASPRGKIERTFTVIVAGGVVNLIIGGHGEVIARSNVIEQAASDPQMRTGLLSGAGKTGANLDAVVARAKAADRS